MLLTSSQVSIALSSGVVFVFTAALFFSGYAIQQRTLRDLRAAIKPSPRPEPQIFLPDRFKKSTTELPDGTVVEVDDDTSYEYGPRGKNKQKPLRGQKDKGSNGFVVEIKPTLPEEGKGGSSSLNSKLKDKKSKSDRKASSSSPNPPTRANNNEKNKGGMKQDNAKMEKKQTGNEKKGTPQEQRQQEQQKQKPPPESYVPHPNNPEKMISKAERRRLIKEELQKLSQGTERGYYQRRLW